MAPHWMRSGDSYYDEAQKSILYYQGDGTNTAVILPEGTTVTGVIPMFDYSIRDREDGEKIVIFTDAIPLGAGIEISLVEVHKEE